MGVIRSFVGVIALFVALSANAGYIVPCGEPECSVSFSVFVDGSTEEAGGGMLWYDAETGEISLDTNNIRGGGMMNQETQGIMWNFDDGSQFAVNSLYGNADPILGFGLGASTGSSAKTFAVTFDLPIALEGPIDASSSISYSLTSTTEAGAQITPLNGKVLTAFEVDSDIGGLGVLNKGVDAGDPFGFVGGPQTQNSSVYTASNTITGDLAYDLMTAQIAFSLSANSNVGISGFVQQVPVPLPASLPLILAGFALLGFIKRR